MPVTGASAGIHDPVSRSDDGHLGCAADPNAAVVERFDPVGCDDESVRQFRGSLLSARRVESAAVKRSVIDAASRLVAFSMFLLVSCMLSVWAWAQVIQWVAEDVKCP